MSCCEEKIKIERLKTFTHASVLAMQTAHIIGIKQAVIKKTHHLYGDYYEGVNYEKAKGLTIYITHTKTGKWKIPKSVTEVLD